MSAPKVAGAWTEDLDGYWVRLDVPLGGYAARATKNGRASADAALRAAGWLLVDAAPTGAETKEDEHV